MSPRLRTSLSPLPLQYSVNSESSVTTSYKMVVSLKNFVKRRVLLKNAIKCVSTPKEWPLKSALTLLLKNSTTQVITWLVWGMLVFYNLGPAFFARNKGQEKKTPITKDNPLPCISFTPPPSDKVANKCPSLFPPSFFNNPLRPRRDHHQGSPNNKRDKVMRIIKMFT